MSELPKYDISVRDSALRQGEFLTGIIQYKPIITDGSQFENDDIKLEKIIHPYVIVTTQDCDLDWDFRAREEIKSTGEIEKKRGKLLNSILLCEIDTAKSIRPDKNLIDNRKEWELVSANRHERFYFFEMIPLDLDLEGEGLPELTADFKKVFAVEADVLYSQITAGVAKRRTTLAHPYLEHFSVRYRSFHGRVALPSLYSSMKEG